jgi:hypothetical protein
MLELMRSGHPDGRALARVLIERSKTDPLASRVMLQAMLPPLVLLARRSGHDDPDAAGAVVGLAWILIRTYPSERAGDVAANLFWDVRKHYLQSRLEPDLPFDESLHDRPAPAAEDLALDRLSVNEMRARMRRLSGSEHAFEVLWSTRVEGHAPAEIAERHGLSRHGLVQRRRRTEQVLRVALGT